jgi:hypothetical protein
LPRNLAKSLCALYSGTLSSSVSTLEEDLFLTLLLASFSVFLAAGFSTDFSVDRSREVAISLDCLARFFASAAASSAFLCCAI